MQGKRHDQISRVQRTWLFRKTQLELFLFVDFHVTHVFAKNFIGVYDIIMTCREVDIAHGQIGATDHVVFVSPDEHHRRAIGISRNGVQPKFDELNRVLLVVLAVFVAS